MNVNNSAKVIECTLCGDCENNCQTYPIHITIGCTRKRWGVIKSLAGLSALSICTPRAQIIRGLNNRGSSQNWKEYNGGSN